MTLTAADAHGELIEQLDARVREIVRAEGVDPQRERCWYAGSPRGWCVPTTSGA